ncbi:helix-turn-helix transcriptional regulator [Methylocystis sp.]|uniref:ArsR/SmtB family transcription factor n=1 Tax=Methylocystis sp. TaxID=1911079 RepID=UPI0025CFC587|nr:metalloregulator ArsR/SmtB family transcription factor [Methylocystis sp.]
MPKRSEKLDLMFSVLADPTRRAMIERLARGPANVSELARPLKMSLPAVTQHLQTLEQSGLVTSRKVGRVRTCRIQPKRFDAAQAWLGRQRAEWEARFDRLDAFLEKSEEKDERSKPRS